jgi:glycosyltransferase involved in cell wall biosynthesis
MRVLFDHQTFSHQRFGGNSRYFSELMTAFHAAGEPSFDLGVVVSPNEYLARAPFYRGRASSGTGTGRLGFVRTYLRNAVATHAAALRARHDVLHVTFYDPGALRYRRGAKLVVTVLDMIPERFPELFDTRSLYGRLVTRRWIEGKRILCQQADAILAISEHTKRDLVTSFGIDPARVTVTHLATGLAGGADRPRPDGLPPRYLLFVGTRNTYKNFELFVAAVAPLLLEDAGLGVLCVGGGAFTAAEHELLGRHGVSGRVLQRGVRDDELAACYAHAACFVFPSRYEGFGIPILEAFACGCPALVADASCFPEIAGDGALTFDPDDAQELRARVRQVLADDTLAAALRARGLARARRFTWQETARRTLDVYRALTAAPARIAS